MQAGVCSSHVVLAVTMMGMVTHGFHNLPTSTVPQPPTTPIHTSHVERVGMALPSPTMPRTLVVRWWLTGVAGMVGSHPLPTAFEVQTRPVGGGGDNAHPAGEGVGEEAWISAPIPPPRRQWSVQQVWLQLGGGESPQSARFRLAWRAPQEHATWLGGTTSTVTPWLEWNAPAHALATALNTLPSLMTAGVGVMVSHAAVPPTRGEDTDRQHSWRITFMDDGVRQPLIQVAASHGLAHAVVEEVVCGGVVPAACGACAAPGSACTAVVTGVQPGVPHAVRVRGIGASGAPGPWEYGLHTATAAGVESIAPAQRVITVTTTGVVATGMATPVLHPIQPEDVARDAVSLTWDDVPPLAGWEVVGYAVQSVEVLPDSYRTRLVEQVYASMMAGSGGGGGPATPRAVRAAMPGFLTEPPWLPWRNHTQVLDREVLIRGDDKVHLGGRPPFAVRCSFHGEPPITIPPTHAQLAALQMDPTTVAAGLTAPAPYPITHRAGADAEAMDQPACTYTLWVTGLNPASVHRFRIAAVVRPIAIVDGRPIAMGAPSIGPFSNATERVRTLPLHPLVGRVGGHGTPSSAHVATNEDRLLAGLAPLQRVTCVTGDSGADGVPPRALHRLCSGLQGGSQAGVPGGASDGDYVPGIGVPGGDNAGTGAGPSLPGSDPADTGGHGLVLIHVYDVEPGSLRAPSPPSKPVAMHAFMYQDDRWHPSAPTGPSSMGVGVHTTGWGRHVRHVIPFTPSQPTTPSEFIVPAAQMQGLRQPGLVHIKAWGGGGGCASVPAGWMQSRWTLPNAAATNGSAADGRGDSQVARHWGGAGAFASAWLPVVPGTRLWVMVGRGGAASPGDVGGAGGYPDGGAGGMGSVHAGVDGGGGGGGGGGSSSVWMVAPNAMVAAGSTTAQTPGSQTRVPLFHALRQYTLPAVVAGGGGGGGWSPACCAHGGGGEGGMPRTLPHPPADGHHSQQRTRNANTAVQDDAATAGGGGRPGSWLQGGAGCSHDLGGAGGGGGGVVGGGSGGCGRLGGGGGGGGGSYIHAPWVAVWGRAHPPAPAPIPVAVTARSVALHWSHYTFPTHDTRPLAAAVLASLPPWPPVTPAPSAFIPRVINATQGSAGSAAGVSPLRPIVGSSPAHYILHFRPVNGSGRGRVADEEGWVEWQRLTVQREPTEPAVDAGTRWACRVDDDGMQHRQRGGEGDACRASAAGIQTILSHLEPNTTYTIRLTATDGTHPRSSAPSVAVVVATTPPPSLSWRPVPTRGDTASAFTSPHQATHVGNATRRHQAMRERRLTRPPPLRGASLTALDERYLLLYGGLSAGRPCTGPHHPPSCRKFTGVRSETWRFDTLLRTWSLLPILDDDTPPARERHVATMHEGRLYIWGGRSHPDRDRDGGPFLADMWVLDLGGDSQHGVEASMCHGEVTGFNPASGHHADRYDLASPTGGVDVGTVLLPLDVPAACPLPSSKQWGAEGGEAATPRCILDVSVAMDMWHLCPSTLRLALLGPGPATHPVTSGTPEGLGGRAPQLQAGGAATHPRPAYAWGALDVPSNGSSQHGRASGGGIGGAGHDPSPEWSAWYDMVHSLHGRRVELMAAANRSRACDITPTIARDSTILFHTALLRNRHPTLLRFDDTATVPAARCCAMQRFAALPVMYSPMGQPCDPLPVDGGAQPGCQPPHVTPHPHVPPAAHTTYSDLPPTDPWSDIAASQLQPGEPTGSVVMLPTGAFRPLQPLATLRRARMTGRWALSITDTVEDGLAARLHRWAVTIRHAPCMSAPRWTRVQPQGDVAPQPRVDAAAVRVGMGRAAVWYVWSGMGPDGLNEVGGVAQVWRFHFHTATWSTLAPLRQSPHHAALVAFRDGGADATLSAHDAMVLAPLIRPHHAAALVLVRTHHPYHATWWAIGGLPRQALTSRGTADTGSMWNESQPVHVFSWDGRWQSMATTPHTIGTHATHPSHLNRRAYSGVAYMEPRAMSHSQVPWSVPQSAGLDAVQAVASHLPPLCRPHPQGTMWLYGGVHTVSGTLRDDVWQLHVPPSQGVAEGDADRPPAVGLMWCPSS